MRKEIVIIVMILMTFFYSGCRKNMHSEEIAITETTAIIEVIVPTVAQEPTAGLTRESPEDEEIEPVENMETISTRATETSEEKTSENKADSKIELLDSDAVKDCTASANLSGETPED